MVINKNIPYGKQSIDENDIESVLRSLKSDWLTQGPKIQEFEKTLADYCGAKYAIAVCNGTAALHLANLALGTKSEIKVITTPITFLATANSILYAGGDPIFSDISQGTFNINSKGLFKTLDSNHNVKGIIPVHLGGVVCDMDAIKDFADKNKLWIIEDACHAFGGKWMDKKGNIQKVGNCSHSDMTTFSFHPVKHITTGEGGVITTNNKKLYEKLLLLRTHGMTKDSKKLNQNHGDWYYEMQTLGYNYRITDLQAALGLEQIKKSDKWVKLRRELVSNYDYAFRNFEELSFQKHPDTDGSYSYHLYIIQCAKRKELYQFLNDNGVNTQVHYIPVHLQPYYKLRYGYKKNSFPQAENYYKHALSLPLYPTLSFSDQKKVISLIDKFYANSRIHS